MNKEIILTLLINKEFTAIKSIFEIANPADLALLFEEFSEKELVLLFRLLTKDKAAETFAYMDSELQRILIEAFTEKELRDVMEELYVDDTVDIIKEMPANVVTRILQISDPKTRESINTILDYPNDSAGSLMTTEYVNLRKDLTVKEALDRIRKVGVDKETIYTCYVTEHRKLIGIVSVKDMLLSDLNQTIDEIMETNVIFLNTHEDRETVVKMFDKYDFLAIPVVDQEQYLVGIVTIDDAMDVLQEETTEDITKMAAVVPSEESYFNTSVLKHAKNRILWLLLLMLSATLTGAIITEYENAFATIPLLVSFIPMLMDTGGNCGAQTSTMIIRGLALDEIHFSDFFKALFKEFRIALIVSVILSAVNGLRILLMYHDPLLALTISLSLIGTVILSKCIGCMLPMIAKKCKVDPAIMAAPLITTLVDTCSVLVYFNIAMRIFKL
ncbi:magnesium transporter [Clostridium sp. Marseille-P299]|uniref:magnesium transporter n=1 Tax=Clostridium sp. Marseille-P299 TaxID=1805477 RepID=UPI00082D7A87|nr:magnesium transporter [Clostridium sp. Marseille-P299]